MKKISILVLLFITLFSCSKRWDRVGDICISADKESVAVDELVNISNCGDELPTNYVEAELDWGDGNISSGQTGSHAYDTTGIYTIKLILNGDEATEVVDIEETKVIIEINVQ